MPREAIRSGIDLAQDTTRAESYAECWNPIGFTLPMRKARWLRRGVVAGGAFNVEKDSK
jgi:hypothetical protein